MTTRHQEIELVGFEKALALGDLLKRFGVCEDFLAILPVHLTDILRKQHPDVVLDRVELLSTSDCQVGGMKDEADENLVCVQDMDVTLRLRVALHVGETRSLLDVRLVLRCTGLDTDPKMVSDMFVVAQTRPE